MKSLVALFVILALISCGTTMGSRDNPIKNCFDSGKIHFGATKAEVATLLGGEPPFHCRKAKATAEGQKDLWDLATQSCAPNPSEPYVLIFIDGRFSEIRWSCPPYVLRLFESF